MTRHLLILPTRVITCILAFLSIVVAYMLRQALIYSLVHLVPKPIPTGSSEDVCPIDSNSTKAFGYSYSATARSTVYDWSGDEQSTIRSSFFWLYIFTHVPGALLAQRIGGRDASLFAMLICAIFTLVTPVALDWGGIAGLLVARVLVGAGEGILWPAVSTWVAAWVPPEERTQSVSLVFSGVEIGAFMGNICSGRLIDAYGWESTFYVFGGISVIWCLVTFILSANDPFSHTYISNKERNYLQSSIGELKRRTDLPTTPWCGIMRSPPVYAIIIAQIGHTWGLFMVLNDLPKYMNDVLHFSIKSNGDFMSLPWLFMWVVTIGTGVLGDYLITHKLMGRTLLRKLYTSVASLGPAIFLVLASYAGCDKTTVVIMFCAAMAFMGPYFPGIKTNCLDMAPNYAGVLMALSNGAGGIMGLIGPKVVGLITRNSLLREWRLAFWLAFIIMTVSAIIYDIFATTSVLWWNDPDAYPRRQKNQRVDTNSDIVSKA